MLRQIMLHQIWKLTSWISLTKFVTKFYMQLHAMLVPTSDTSGCHRNIKTAMQSLLAERKYSFCTGTSWISLVSFGFWCHFSKLLSWIFETDIKHFIWKYCVVLYLYNIIMLYISFLLMTFEKFPTFSILTSLI